VVVIETLETLVGDRGAGQVSAEAFEAVTIASANRDIRVKVEPVRARTARAKLLRGCRTQQAPQPARRAPRGRAKSRATGQRPAVALAERCVIGRDDGLAEAAVCFVVEEPSATKHTNRIPTYSADDLGDVLGGWYGDSDELDGVSGCVQREHAVGGRGVKVGIQP
jgi:hypothetical protein